MPLGALAIFVITFNYWNNATFALEVIYNDQSIGYISDESIFIEAKKMVQDRLSSSAYADKSTIEAPVAAASSNLRADYNLSVVSIDKLNDAQAISDRMIENSVDNLTHACGIYIDGEFICAVKNEADAKTVFYDILEPYEAENASHLISDTYRDADGQWYGIYKGILGFMVNQDELDRMGIEAPKDWADLLDPKYKDLIWLSNYNTAGTAKLVVNTMIQKYGHDEGIQYLVDLDKNIQVYTKSGSGPSKNVGTGECVIGIGFLHDGITQIEDNGYGNISLIIPSSGTSFEIGATAIFKGCKHPNAAKLWIEYALSPDCVELAAQNGSYQFLVIDNAEQPAVAAEFGLDPDNVMEYDFEDAKENTTQYVEDVMNALGSAADDRFQTE
jgi:ABC-type Fe3+ transport system substrate-binding protein